MISGSPISGAPVMGSGGVTLPRKPWANAITITASTGRYDLEAKTGPIKVEAKTGRYELRGEQ